MGHAILRIFSLLLLFFVTRSVQLYSFRIRLPAKQTGNEAVNIWLRYRHVPCGKNIGLAERLRTYILSFVTDILKLVKRFPCIYIDRQCLLKQHGAAWVFKIWTDLSQENVRDCRVGASTGSFYSSIHHLLKW